MAVNGSSTESETTKPDDPWAPAASPSGTESGFWVANDTGLLGRVGQTANTPLTFDNSPAIRDQPIIQPSTNPVDVPGAREATGPLQATGPVGFSGPNQMGYGGQRVGPGQMVGGPQQYGQVGGPGQSNLIGGPGQSQTIRNASRSRR